MVQIFTYDDKRNLEAGELMLIFIFSKSPKCQVYKETPAWYGSEYNNFQHTKCLGHGLAIKST